MTSKKVTVKAKKKNLSLAKTSPQSVYNKDFYAWVEEQTDLLKHKNFSSLDIGNLIEEIESLGRNDKRSLKSHLIVLLQHLLKLEYQPNLIYHLNSWKSSVSDARREIILLLDDSPSLIKELYEIFDGSYILARKYAIEETGLKSETFPKECQWSIEEVFPNLKKKNKLKLKSKNLKWGIGSRRIHDKGIY